MTRPLHQNAVHQNSPRKDAVDGIIAAWARERPDLPVEVMEVWSRVTRLARRLDRDRAKAFSQWDLEGWEFDVLAALRLTALQGCQIAVWCVVFPIPRTGAGSSSNLPMRGAIGSMEPWQPCWSPRDVCSTRWMPRSSNRWVKVYVPCWPVMRNWTEGFLSRCDG